MQYKKTGKYLMLTGLILVILGIVTTGLTWRDYSTDFGTWPIIVGIVQILYYIGLFTLLLGALFYKDFSRDWFYALGFLILGTLVAELNIIITVILLILSIFFALVINEEGDRHGLIIAGVDIILIMLIILTRWIIHDFITNTTPNIIFTLF